MRLPLVSLLLAATVGSVVAATATAQSSGVRTYANPIDIDYKYNWEQFQLGISYRSGADPVIVNHRGEYFLFVTVSGGYWHSTDLIRWRFVTPSRNWNFERRIAMFPAGFDADGHMFASTRFGDFPHRVPTARWQRPDELFTGWMLLSYRKPVVASSTRDSFPATAVTDENPRTFWVARDGAPGATLTLDLGGERELRALQVNYADYRSGLFASDSTVYTQFVVHASRDGHTWTPIADLTRERRDRPNAYVELPAPVRARWVRWEHVHVGAAHLAVSDIRVFGTAGGRAPATPAGVAARRDVDARNALVTWRPVPGAVGYNVRWGIAPTKLYQTYQRWADQGTQAEVRALTVGQPYWFAVEAFDESGVSAVSAPVPVAP